MLYVHSDIVYILTFTSTPFMQFLMFEVNNYVGSLDADAPMLAVTNVLVKARRCGVDLYTAFNHKSMHKS